MATAIDYLDNQAPRLDFNISPDYQDGLAQAFTGNGRLINTCKFYLKKVGSPTGTLSAKIYNIAGTFGSNAIPSGGALATSNTFNVSTLTTSYVLTTFTFATPYQTTAGAKYAISCEGINALWVGGVTCPIIASEDTVGNNHKGNSSYYLGPPTDLWNSGGASDLFFYIYTTEDFPHFHNKVRNISVGNGMSRSERSL